MKTPIRFTYRVFSFIFLIYLFTGVSTSLYSQNKDSVLQVLKVAGHDTVRCNLFYLLSNIEFDDNVWPKYNGEAFKIANKHVGNKNRLQSKEDSFYNFHLANCYSNYGLIAHSKGDFNKATQFYNKALERERLTNNKLNIATVYNNMGGVYSDQRIFQTAAEYFLKSLEMRQQINDVDGVEQSYSNLGSVYDELDDTTKARYYYFKALELFKKTNNLPRGAATYNNLGSFFKNLNDFKKSQEYFEKSLEIQYQLNNKRGMCYVLGNIAVILQMQKKYKEAKEYGLKAMKLAKELGFPTNIKSQAILLYGVDTALGNWKEAHGYYKLFVKMRDSIMSVENAKATMKQQIQSDYDKQKAVDQALHDKELLVSAEKEQKQKVISISIGIVLLLMILLAYFIFNRLRITNKQKKIIEEQKHIVEEKNHIIEEKQKEIIDSINYAKRIQHTLLAHDEFLSDNLPEHFVFFKPKDIVSGDFYWATKIVQSGLNNLNTVERFYLAVCDSTGHGVPGAFMSLLNISFLNEAINEKMIYEPNEILNHVRQRLIDEISKDGAKDGMDAVLICIERIKEKDGTETKKITYAAANNHPVLISGNSCIELGKDKMPVGKGERIEPFTLRTIEAKNGDSLYLYTDGFADQFGGPKGKKFKYKVLNQLLADNNGLSSEEQKNKLETNFESWKGALEQVDDVCVIGIKL